MSVHADMRKHHKVIYFSLMAFLLIVEFRAMDKDRIEAQESQDRFERGEKERLGRLLDTERENARKLLDQENKSFSRNLRQDQQEFESTISALLTARRQDEREFAGVIQREDGVIQSEKELSEQFMGRLIPGHEPTPENACTHEFGSLKPDEMLVLLGDNAVVTQKDSFPIVAIGNSRVISINRAQDSDQIALGVDFRDNLDRILMRVNEEGIVNRTTGFLLLHPDKSTLSIEDEYGRAFLKVEYLNPNALRVSGHGIYCGKRFDLQSPLMHDSCLMGAGMKLDAPDCSMPQQ